MNEIIVCVLKTEYERAGINKRRTQKKMNTNLVLATNVPDSEADILIFNSLNIETWK